MESSGNNAQQQQNNKQESNKKRKANKWKEMHNKKRQKQEKKQKMLPGNENADEMDKPADEWQLNQFKIGSPKFDQYYKKQFPFMSDEEFKEFTEILQEKLPVTFRINQTQMNHEKAIAIFKDPRFLESYYKQEEKTGEKEDDMRSMQIDMSLIKLECKKYYPPGNVLFELTVPRQLLKKNAGLKAIHQMIQQSNDCGILTRQEIVSMLPPILLDIHADHAVFDMCAAPGSKTAQVFELMMSSHLFEHEKSNTMQTKGFIVANDADSKRAYMLTHQMNRLNTSNIVILNHQAQNFPLLCYKNYESERDQFDSRVHFDRIICDVPCSSDAAIRKIPQKWDKWATNDGAALHVLQAKILFKGLQMLKVGGKLSYSTCSLNPIEDESVVASALKYFEGCIELVEVDLPGFKFRKGLQQWKVMSEKIEKDPLDENFFFEMDSYCKIPEEYTRRGIKETMFTDFYDESVLKQLPKCLRVFPHDQNTSGFFITIIKKIKDFDANFQNNEEQKTQQQPIASSKNFSLVSKEPLPLVIQKKTQLHTFEFTRCDPKDPDIEYLKAYYGLTEDFPVDQLVTQSDEMKKLFFISPAVSQFLYSDCDTNNLNIINMGSVLFMRNSSKFSSNVECIFRISQDGILNVVPYMTKRLIWVSTEEQFKYFLMHKNIEMPEIEDEKLRTSIDNLSTGCFVLAIKLKGESVEAVTMHKFTKAVNMMVSRENIISLHLRFLTKEEREKVSGLFESGK